MTNNNLSELWGRNRWFSGLRILIAALIAVPPPLWANPSGGSVVSGAAHITSSGSTLTVQQLTNNAIINWHDFSINSGELTKFVQPSALSAALNRVTGGDPSAIYGKLQANGRLYLINPNGITVGATGVINTQSFVASSLDVSNSAFLAGGNITFSGNSLAGVSNAGQINALGGDVLLVAHTVQNTGSLNATGTAGLAAGSEVLFTATGNQRVFVQAGSGSAATGVDQKGQIQAASAELTAAGGNIYGLAINNEGTVQANGINNVGGHIFLTANDGAVSTSGQLSATGQGGQVSVTGGQISLGGNVTSNGAQTYAGPVLLTANDSLTGNGISFQGTVDGAEALTLNSGQGAAAFDDAVGGKTPLSALTVYGIADEEGGAITTSGNLVFAGAFIANPSAVLTSQAGILDFNGSVNVGNNLTTNSPITIFNGPAFLGGSLTSNITGVDGSIIFGDGPVTVNPITITSGGDQTYSGPIYVVDSTDLSSLYGNLNFNGSINSVSESITMPNSRPGTGSNLITNSAWNTNFNGPISIKTLTSNITGAGEINLNNGAVTTVSDQTYNGPVYAQQNTTLTSSEGNLIFNGPVNAGFNLLTNSALNTDFNGAVFLGDSLTSNITRAGSINLGAGSVVSGGDQTYNGSVSLGSDNKLSSLYGSLNFNGTIDGAYNLTSNSYWNTTFSQIVGGKTLLSSLTSNITGLGEINLNGGFVVTLNDQTYNGVIFANPNTTLTSDLGNLNFDKAVNAGFNLITSAAKTTTFGGPVSLGDGLSASVTAFGGEIALNGGSVVSGGDQTYNGPVKLGSDNTLKSDYGSLYFNGTIDGGYNLAVEAPSNSVTFNQAVGGATPLESLTVTDNPSFGDFIYLNGGAITTIDNQSYNLFLSLGTNNTLASNEGNISFQDVIYNGNTLTVTPGGTQTNP